MLFNMMLVYSRAIVPNRMDPALTSSLSDIHSTSYVFIISDWSIDWLFNGMSTRKGQFVTNAGEWNQFSRARMAKEIQCILPYVTWKQCNTVHRITPQLHKSNNRLSNIMTYLLIITHAPSPIPSQIPHTLFDIISLRVDAVLCHDQAICRTVHACARSKMPQ